MGSCCCKKGTQVVHPQRISDASTDPLFTKIDSDNESDTETGGKFDQVGISTSDRSKLIDRYQSEPLVSLEEALKPFKGKINGLPIQIKQAKERCHYPSEHDLTRDESSAIYLYSMRHNQHAVYNHLQNAWQSGNRSQMQPWFKYLRLLKSGLDKLPNAKTEVWQGIPHDPEWSKTLQSNSVPLYTCMGTCSPSVSHVKDELDRKPTAETILVGYESINGKDVTGYTANHEKEVMVWPGIRLKKTRDGEVDQHGSLTMHFTGKSTEPRKNVSTPYPTKSPSSLDSARSDPVPPTKAMTPDHKHFICPLSACGNHCRGDHHARHCNGFSFLFRHVSHHCGARQSCFHCNTQLDNLFECHTCRGRFCERCSFK